jgi:thiosulfate/3-mercaptopyruvate sulfurtransferase
MQPSPLVSSRDLGALGPLRLIYVPTADERPEGLTSVPIESWIDRAKQSQSGFDDLGFWQQAIDELGVGTDALSVVLDDGRMTEAARVCFILQYFGLPAAVLNGGLSALDHRPRQTPPVAEPVTLRPGTGRVGLMNRDRLKQELPRVQVFDARSKAEFRGKDLKGNARGGHIPGAAHLPHDELVMGTHLRPAEEIAALLDEARIDGARPIVSHCNGGGRGALAALAAVVAGREDVHVYYLSFADWAADETCPVNSGTE